jgi:hypothetical protein
MHGDSPNDVTHLTGDEIEVLFVPGQEFAGVTEEWLRPRLRLNPVLGSINVEEMSLHVYLDNEVLEDFEAQSILGIGPNDGDFVKIESYNESGGLAWIMGGWLNFSAPEIIHTVTWIGQEPIWKEIYEDLIMEIFNFWDECEVIVLHAGLRNQI